MPAKYVFIENTFYWRKRKHTLSGALVPILHRKMEAYLVTSCLELWILLNEGLGSVYYRKCVWVRSRPWSQMQRLILVSEGLLTLVMLNKLRCLAYFQFSANQITWSGLLIQVHILNGKQCRSRSVGFFRSQLIWIYTVCKDRVYPGSAGQGLIKKQ